MQKLKEPQLVDDKFISYEKKYSFVHWPIKLPYFSK